MVGDYSQYKDYIWRLTQVIGKLKAIKLLMVQLLTAKYKQALLFKSANNGFILREEWHATLVRTTEAVVVCSAEDAANGQCLTKFPV